MYPMDILVSLSNSIKDPDYHGPSAVWEAFIKDGVDTYYDIHSVVATVDLEYVHTAYNGERGYSTARISEGSSRPILANYREMTKLLEKLVKRCGKESDGEWYDPKGYYDFHLNDLPLVVATLEKMGAKRIQSYTPSCQFGSLLVPYRCTLPTVFRGQEEVSCPAA